MIEIAPWGCTPGSPLGCVWRSAYRLHRSLRYELQPTLPTSAPHLAVVEVAVRHLPGQQLMHDGAKRPHIARHPAGAAGQALGRQPPRVLDARSGRSGALPYA